MKRLQVILILFLLGVTIPAFANDQEEQVDLLLAKIRTALENDRMSEALSACAKLEKLGASLEKSLPESFYFNYIEALHRSGAKEVVLKRAAAYLEKYGKSAPHSEEVSTIVRKLQVVAITEGREDAEAVAASAARAEVQRLQSEKERAQTLVLMRSCQSEAIALEGAEKELSATFNAINTQSEALLTLKAALDRRAAMIDASGPGPLEERRAMILDFNRDSQAYNDAVNDFIGARESYDAQAEGQSSRFQSYKDRCSSLTVMKSDLEAFCGLSDDWFCYGVR